MEEKELAEVDGAAQGGEEQQQEAAAPGKTEQGVEEAPPATAPAEPPVQQSDAHLDAPSGVAHPGSGHQSVVRSEVQS